MVAGEPRGEGVATGRKAAAASTLGNPTRELAEYRVWLEQADERRRREDAERVRDISRRRLASREDTPGCPADDAPPDRDEGPREGTETPQVVQEVRRVIGGEDAVLPRPSRLVGRTLGRTLGLVGSLALRLGVARRALLILGAVIVASGLLGLSVIALLLGR